MTAGMRALTSVASSPLLDKAGMRKPLEKLVFHGTRAGFNAATRAVEFTKPKRETPREQGEVRVALDSSGAPKLFDLTPSDEQEMIQETVRRFAREQIRDVSREADTRTEMPPGIVEAFNELGVRDMLIPEAFGGFAEGRSPLTTALILEELSYGDMGIALALYAPLAVLNATVDFGSGRQQKYWIDALAEEGAAAAIAFTEPQPLFDPFEMQCAARPTGTGFRISGIKTLVPLALSCEFYLVAASIPGGEPGLFFVDRHAPGVSVKAAPSMGLRCAELGEVTFDRVEIPLENQLGEGETGFSWDRFVQSSRLATAAMAVGVARAVVDFVGPYANERHAFGAPISHRQAVAFLIADMALETEGLRLQMLRGASQLEYGRDATRSAYLAHLLTAEKAMFIGTSGVQLLGGHGFVKEYLMELWYRNLRAAGILHGGLYL